MKFNLMILAFFGFLLSACESTYQDDIADQTFKKIHDTAQQGG